MTTNRITNITEAVFADVKDSDKFIIDNLIDNSRSVSLLSLKKILLSHYIGTIKEDFEPGHQTLTEYTRDSIRYMRMNGQSCEGTLYEEKTGILNVPNIENWDKGGFVRALPIDSTEVVGTQEDEAIQELTSTISFTETGDDTGLEAPFWYDTTKQEYFTHHTGTGLVNELGSTDNFNGRYIDTLRRKVPTGVTLDDSIQQARIGGAAIPDIAKAESSDRHRDISEGALNGRYVNNKVTVIEVNGVKAVDYNTVRNNLGTVLDLTQAEPGQDTKARIYGAGFRTLDHSPRIILSNPILNQRGINTSDSTRPNNISANFFIAVDIVES